MARTSLWRFQRSWQAQGNPGLPRFATILGLPPGRKELSFESRRRPGNHGAAAFADAFYLPDSICKQELR
jgi:hypothetical protein